MSWDNTRAVADAVHQHLSPTNPAGSFLITGYKDDNTLTVLESGTGGVEVLKERLAEDKVLYILLRITDIKDGNALYRDVLLSWWGPKVSKIKAARMRTHHSLVFDTLRPNHSQLEVLGKREFTEQIIRDRSSPGSGSHVIE
ncbi:hypothetical protein H696_01382 [Fonticula alba]|uniref:ADF-H domain-containing protein n=1 Tax=Fonticula alba TaxID=691883 RepID=A0A058ZC70_FONAL|nr:hypothetical protein H696_01382 [Fonticula alba]KCV71974.1 hypothetical protein H696_01382 [Fonticula alba]|eukprot:XP_009493552.1 hypothetical protein H696_01382 [Fonticula alba]